MAGAFDQPAASTVAAASGLLRHPLRVGVLAGTGAALAALLLPTLHRPQLRLVWNASVSVPLGLYGIEPDAIPRVGDLVAVRPSPALTRFMAERRYVEAGALLVKPVAALAGTTFCRTGMRVMLDGRAVATAQPRDRFGRPQPRWSGCRRVARSEIVLIAPALHASFDSRYFGAIDGTRVIGRAIPLWT